MSFLDEIAKSAFGCTTEEAQAKTQCICCKQKVNLTALTEDDRKEYDLSGLCPKCYAEIMEEGLE